ncbi:hypothetical protein PVAND_005244 [Polypedilum vanderplanki]|uniref:Ubiquinone biosynthesis O-methyltransferase, mitochondrial n=1 Tax=Polypedilum vanderplanki TaxID=319348 RepID=A0A9J6C1H6_POLVA|nr:hypothetical protein PVAND_005244 [Polypedilum vanderplanki]
MKTDQQLLEKNVSPSEIKQYSPMAKEWWNTKDGPMYILHDMNKMRLDLVFDGLISTGVIKSWQRNEPNAFQGLKILDLGCGGGILVEALAKLKAEVTGLDPNEALLEVAKEHIETQEDIRGNVRYLLETIEEHCKTHPNYYDVITCSEVLEHVIDKKSLLEAACKSLKPGGSIFVTTYNKTFFSWFFSILFGEYILRIVPIGCHSYGLFISPYEVSKILENSKCKTNVLKGIFYNFIGRYFWIYQWLGYHYAMQAVKDH